MSGVYYNENNKAAVLQLRTAIRLGLIAPGDVDDRSIEDVAPSDLRGYKQCHFFAGIGGWSLALRKAGWADDREVWTASCPCQPFSTAGKGKGFADARHLFPDLFWLIQKCRPPKIFGEQVSSNDGLVWFDHVSADLESQGYAVAAADLCAAGVGAPHIRQRLYWLADADFQQRPLLPHQQRQRQEPRFANGSIASRLGDALRIGQQGSEHLSVAQQTKEFEQGLEPLHCAGSADAIHGFWDSADWLGCNDGMFRPVEPGTFPLANGVPGRVESLRGYGNAIVPQVAAKFIQASQLI